MRTDACRMAMKSLRVIAMILAVACELTIPDAGLDWTGKTGAPPVTAAEVGWVIDSSQSTDCSAGWC